MKPMPHNCEWMWPKYGVNMRPYWIDIEIQNTNHGSGENVGQFSNINDSLLKYKYSMRNSRTGDMVVERDLRWID